MTSFLFLLILLGSMQGLIMGSILFFGRTRDYSARLLAIRIWTIALPGIHLYLHYIGFFIDLRTPSIIHALVPWMMISATSALLFFYIRSVLNPDFRIGWKHIVWFLPLIVDIFPKVAEVIFIGQLLPASVFPDRAGFTQFINDYNRYADIPRWAAVAYGVVRSYHLLEKYQKMMIAAGTPQQRLIGWLSQYVKVFAVFMVVWLLYLVPYMIPQTAVFLEKTVGWFPVYLPMAVMIYWLGIKGLASARPAFQRQVPGEKTKSNLSTQQMQLVLDQLLLLIDNTKPYLDPSLDLASLSQLSGIPQKQISVSVNQQLGRSVTAFLNEYRVQEFMRRAGQADTLTIAGIASECGFPSLATFQRVFKQATGQTPSEYLRKKAS